MMRILQLLTTLIGWLWNRGEVARAQAAAEAARVEAMRQRAANQETVDRLKDGAAQNVLRERWNRDGPHPPWAVILLVVVLAGCTPATPVVVDTGCDWARPILIGDGDQITDRTAREILIHNETWAVRCRK